MSLGLKYKNQESIFEEKTVNGVPFLSYPMFERTGIVRHGFSTRLGGVSKGSCATMNISITRGDAPEAVAENKRRIVMADRGASGRHDIYTADAYGSCGGCRRSRPGRTFFGDGRNGDECSRYLSCDVLC